MSDIDTEAVDSLKVLDPSWPIREATGLMRHSETSLSAMSRHMHRSKEQRRRSRCLLSRGAVDGCDLCALLLDRSGELAGGADANH